MKGATDGTSKAATSVPTKNSQIQASSVRITHGMFFRLSAEYAEDGVEIVMVMGPESGIEKDEKAYVCADVCISDKTEASYELFVARQRVMKELELNDQVLMEYDSQTRHYYIKA